MHSLMISGKILKASRFEIFLNSKLGKKFHKFKKYNLLIWIVKGILDDRLLDILWKNVLDQKPGLLGLMKKFDLICERRLNFVNKVNKEELFFFSYFLSKQITEYKNKYYL